MQLHGYWSSNPMKVRLALAELGEPYEEVKVDLGSRENRQASYLAIHPRGQVPALVDGDSKVWESGAVLAWLAERSGRLMPTDPASRAKAWSLLFYESAEFQGFASSHFGYHVVAPHFGFPRDEEGFAAAKQKIGRSLDLLQGQLAEGPYLCGEFSIVDCAYAPWFPVIDLGSHPALAAWFARVKARSSWTSLQWAY